MVEQERKPKRWPVILIILVLALVVGGLIGWNRYQQVRSDYDAYRTLIQRGARVAGVDVGWHTPEEARKKVWEWVAEPYYRDFTLHYQDQVLTLSPGDDLNFSIPVDEMVDEAVAASHQYDYWEGFKLWIQNEAEKLELDVPLRMDYDEAATARYLEGVAEARDITPVEPMVDVQNLTFMPGLPGRQLDAKTSATLINERVFDPGQREVTLPVTVVEPDQSRRRIESMLSTLGPVMERPPTPPSFYTATIPLSTTGGIDGTPTVSYSGELTWTFPHFVSYTGHLTSTYGFFFDLGKPGFTFSVTRATDLVDQAVQAGMTEPFTFEPELVPPPPITRGLLLPPLKARLADFPGVTSILVKNLDSGEVLYESNVDYVLSGMSLSKIGIMVEVYRYFGGEVDAQTHQELVDMLGSESCNPCANRLMAAVGNGSARTGAQKVTQTMHRLGLANFRLCAPFRIVELWDDEADSAYAQYRQFDGFQPLQFGYAPPGPFICTGGAVSTPMMASASALTGLWQAQAQRPGYDPCVKATPREMANLVEMIYACTQDEGLLRGAYPNIFTPAVCEDMIDIMAANDLRNMLGAGIPHDVKLAHKHGFSGYGVDWGDTRAEVGIVYAPGATWLISFYIWEDTPWINWGINQPLYRDVSNMLYNYFSPEAQYWPLPPWAPAPEEDTGEDGS
jgi:hypothetical protein